VTYIFLLTQCMGKWDSIMALNEINKESPYNKECADGDVRVPNIK